MQTFLPYADPRRSAAVLDDRRLGKQRVETYQILRALVWPTYAWKNHPAVRMWRGFVPALVSYGLAVCDEWAARGRADATRSAILDFTGGREPGWVRLRDEGQLPPWIGDTGLHRSHRSALVRKDPAHYLEWLEQVPADLPYVWPAAVYPRWPIRRGGAAALPVAGALALLGLDGLSSEQEAAVAAVCGGRDHDLATTVRDDTSGDDSARDDSARRVATGLDAAHETALLASLVTPGRTVWLVPGDVPPAPGPPPAALPTSGRVAPTSARRPGPAEIAATQEEATAEPELVFLRPAQLSTSTVARHRAGLLLVDGRIDLGALSPAVRRSWSSVPVLRLPAGPWGSR